MLCVLLLHKYLGMYLEKSSNCWEKHQNYFLSIEPNSMSNVILFTNFVLIFSHFNTWVISSFFFSHPQVKELFSMHSFTFEIKR